MEKGFRSAVETPKRVHHIRKVGKPLALRPGPQQRGLFAELARPQGPYENGRLGRHPFAGDGRGALVAMEKIGEVPGRYMFPADPAAKRRGMIGVGARQRCQHARCGPARKPSGFYRLQDLFREGFKEVKASCHPARVPAKPAGNLSLGHLVAIDKMPHKGGLLHHVPSSLTAGREHPNQCLILLAAPLLGQDRVPFAKFERRHPPVAVDEHTGEDGDDRSALPPLLDRCGKADQGLPFHNPGVSVSQVKVCDFHFPGRNCAHLFSLHGRQPPHRKASRMI